MKELLSNLIEALREELKQYGEMLALLDQQQQLVMQRQVAALPENVNCVNLQAGVIAAARQEREQRQRHLARLLSLPENSAALGLIPHLPSDYRPLVGALVSENNELLIRVQQRARQNHMLLSHAVELMQQLITSIFPSAAPVTYDVSGHTAGKFIPAESLYQAVG
jgi:flagellar biosynthesis/type III secretory pathway chaperone